MPTTLGRTFLTASRIWPRSNTSPIGRSRVVTAAPARPRHIDHALAEDAVDADQHAVARFDQVDDARFHAGHAGAADGERQRVLRAKDLPQASPGFRSSISRNFGSRWPRSGVAIAVNTRGCTSLGPGPIRSRVGGFSWPGIFMVQSRLRKAESQSTQCFIRSCTSLLISLKCG